MNVVIVGRDHFESLEWQFADTLTRLGHKVSVLNSHDTSVIPEKLQYWLTRFYEPYDEHISRRFVAKIRAYAPDMVLVVYRHIHPSVITSLKKQLPNCPIVQYNPDALTNLERQQIIASPFDFYFTKEPYIAEAFRQKAGLNIFYLPEAFNPHINNRPDIDRNTLEVDSNIDVMVYGNMYPYRTRMVERLVQAGIRVTSYGLAAKYMPQSVEATFVGRYLTGEEKNVVINGSKIVLNNLHYAEITSANKKYFEINGTGGFQLCDYKSTLTEYSGIPVEPVTFNTIDEAIDKIRYYLPRLAERHALSERQYQHFREHHTYEHRMREMLDIVFDKQQTPISPAQ